MYNILSCFHFGGEDTLKYLNYGCILLYRYEAAAAKLPTDLKEQQANAKEVAELLKLGSRTWLVGLWLLHNDRQLVDYLINHVVLYSQMNTGVLLRSLI